MRITGALIILIVGLSALAAFTFGQGLPAPYTMRLQTFALSPNVNRPVLLRTSRDGSHRIFVIQQTGIIKIFQPGSNVSTTFIDLTSRIVPVGGLGDERGLLGLAFHPQFATNGKFYCFFNRASDSANTLAEYTTTTGNGNSNTADPSTERVLFAIPDPFTNHNGGNLDFGPDGYLYIGTGDGGSGNDPGNRAQDPSQLLGKMLRIDVNGTPYAIPPTNPFVGVNTTMCPNGSTTSGMTCQEIWTIGMRNPWRWSFDRASVDVGQLWIADVGQNAIEEVDVVSSGGGNYGWRVYEGTSCTGNDPGLCNPNNYIMPLFQYDHSGGRCSITGGYVYRGLLGNLPAGGYVHADYCSGEIWYWNGSQQVLLLDTPRNITSFGEDDDGEIYVCYGTAQIDKLVRAKASADVDGDFKTDIAVYRPSDGIWYALNSSNGSIRQSQFGIPGDIPVPEDYDGDNITDIGVFRPSNGNWAYIRSSDSTAFIIHWGDNGDTPAAGDYNGDAKADLTVFRPSDGYWYTYRTGGSGTTATRFGASTDKPVAGDYDGDGKYDVAVWRDSDGTWYRLNSLNGAFSAVQWGSSGDMTAPGDYDGDGKIDQAVFRPSTGVWYVRLSSTGALQATQWGTAGDIPVAGDYDGDGKDDVGVFRPSNGTWYALRSSNGSLLAIPWGTAGDIPVPSVDNP